MNPLREHFAWVAEYDARACILQRGFHAQHRRHIPGGSRGLMMVVIEQFRV
jgi:hypothetical protein